MDKAIKVELSADGNDLYVFFGGIKAGIAMPPFEFYNSSKIIEQHKIFLRDFDQSWYQCGLPLIGNNIYSVAKYIKLQIEDINPNQVYFVGNSMGGYAAILLSELIGVGRVIAFAPQTFVSPWLRFRYGDRRWRKQIMKMQVKTIFRKRVWDLRSVLSGNREDRKVSVFVSRAHHLDYTHASHIADLQGITIYEFSDGGHDIVKLLRDQGLLPQIMSGRYT